MSREARVYGDGGAVAVQAPLSTEWLDPGYYKIRLHGGGAWVPVLVTLEDGERDPDTWELLSDQWLSAEWWPQTNSTRSYRIDPRRLFARAFPIDRSEFEWLLTLRKIRR
jgi:hypothetical protein